MANVCNACFLLGWLVAYAEQNATIVAFEMKRKRREDDDDSGMVSYCGDGGLAYSP